MGLRGTGASDGAHRYRIFRWGLGGQDLLMGLRGTGASDGAHRYRIFRWGLGGQDLLMGLMAIGSSDGAVGGQELMATRSPDGA